MTPLAFSIIERAAEHPQIISVEWGAQELIVIGAGEDVSEELGVRLDPQRETLETAEIFNELRVERSQHPLQPLFEGKWR